jgi:hypothetical protein
VLRSRLLTLTLLAFLALPVSLARAGIYTQVLRAYQLHGSVPACQFSSQQLASALKGIDTYGAQYFQDFSAAVQAALSARASGVCSPAHARLVPTPRVAGPPLRMSPVGAPTDSSLPVPVLLMAILVVAMALLAAVWGCVLWRGWSPPWSAGWSHAWGEAAYRAEARWLEFTDWLRSGSEI